MTARVSDRRPEIGNNETLRECGAEVGEKAAVANEKSNDAPRRATIPWIGTLPNPHVGPMLVLDAAGSWVPLWTAEDLLRGCRHFWRSARD